MRIRIAGLPQGPQLFVHEGPTSEYLKGPERFLGQIVIRAQVEIENNCLRLNLLTETVGKCKCDRCAESFNRMNENSTTFFYVFDNHDDDLTDSEFGIIPPERDFVRHKSRNP